MLGPHPGALVIPRLSCLCWLLVLPGCPSPTEDKEPDTDTVEETDLPDTDTDTDVPVPVDSDGDGTTDDLDCAPDDPEIHPFAIDTCDDVDRDCDGVPNEGGTILFVAEDGTATDLTSELSGSPTDPFPWTAPGNGTLRLCPGNHSILFTAEDVDLTIEGLGDREEITLDVDGGGRALHLMSTSTVQVRNLTMRSGMPDLDNPLALVEGDSHLELVGITTTRLTGSTGDVESSAAIRLPDGDNRLTVSDNSSLSFVENIFAAGTGTTVTWIDSQISESGVGRSAGTVSFTRSEITAATGGLLLDSATFTTDELVISDSGDSSGLTSPIMLESTGASTLDIQGLEARNIDGRLFDLQGDIVMDDITVLQVISSDGPPSRLRAGSITATNAEFQRCISPGDGGILHVDAGASFTCTTCTFTNSHSEGNGGAIYSEGQIQLATLTLSNNDASGHGGGIYVQGGGLSIQGGIMRNADADGDGGAIWARPALASELIDLDDVEFDACDATNGGAIWAIDTVLELDGCSFGDNRADVGGAIWLQRTLRATNTDFIGNIATISGGAVFGQQLLVTGGRFWRNSAPAAAAIDYQSSVLLDAVNFGTMTDVNPGEDLRSATGVSTDVEGEVSGTCVATGCTLSP